MTAQFTRIGPCRAPRALRGSTVCRELFAHDLAHELLSYRGIHQSKIGSQRVVDQGLIALSGFFGLGLKALKSRVIDINGNTRFPGGGNHRATLAFGKVIYLFHNSFALLESAFLTDMIRTPSCRGVCSVFLRIEFGGHK